MVLASLLLSTQLAISAPNGQALYLQHCASCHQVTGTGLGFEIPSLVLSKKLRGNPAELIAFVLQGSELSGGAISEINIPMPAFRILSDEDLAAILSYTRNTFGDRATTIDPEDIAAVR